MKHLLEHVAARIFQIDQDHVGIDRVDARQQIVGLGDALDVREAGLAQSILEDGGADRAFVDDGDLQRRIPMFPRRRRAGRRRIRTFQRSDQLHCPCRPPQRSAVKRWLACLLCKSRSRPHCPAKEASGLVNPWPEGGTCDRSARSTSANADVPDRFAIRLRIMQLRDYQPALRSARSWRVRPSPAPGPGKAACARRCGQFARSGRRPRPDPAAWRARWQWPASADRGLRRARG